MRFIVHGRSFWFAAVLAVPGALAWGAGEARAGASDGCAAANRGELGADIAAGQSQTRGAVFLPGETLSISIATRAVASVGLVGRDGSLRTLHSGIGSGSAAFAVPSEGSYAFRYTALGDAPVTVRVTCLSSADAAARASFQRRRTNLLKAQEPARVRVDRPDTPVSVTGQPQDNKPQTGQMDFDGSAPKPAAVSVSLSQLAAAEGGKREPSILDFWIEGRYAPYSSAPGADDGSLGLVYVGSDYKLGPDILVGALAQFDRAGETNSFSSPAASGSGWMLGPYMSVRFGPGVVFDGRAAWGSSESGISGVSIGNEAAGTRLVTGRVRGNRDVGGWTFAPSVDLSYVEETPMGLSVEPQAGAAGEGQGRLGVLPEVKRRFAVDSDTYIEPRAALGGFLAFDELAKINPAAVAEEPDLRMKAEAGVAVGLKDGVNVEANGGVETGSKAEPDNWAGRLQLNMPLSK